MSEPIPPAGRRRGPAPGTPKTAAHRARIAEGQKRRYRDLNELAELLQLARPFLERAAQQGDRAADFILQRMDANARTAT